MEPADISLLSSVSAPSLHPDGSRAVVGVAHPDLIADAMVGQLWMVQVQGNGSGARRFTRGFNDFAPEFSPDGSAVAFLRASVGNPPQLHVIKADGGEPLRITDRKLGVSEFHWAPDSSRIAFVSREAEAGRYGTVEGIGPEAEPARHITGLRYKFNGLGYTNDRRAQIFLVPVPPLDAEPVYEPAPLPDGSKQEVELVPPALQVTSGDYDAGSPRFDGDRLLFISARHANRDRDLLSQLWSVQPDGSSGAEPVTDPGSKLSVEAFEVRNGVIHLVAQDLGESGTDFVAQSSALYRLDESGPVRLTDPDVVDLTGSSITLRENSVLVADRARGRLHVLEIGPDGRSTPVTHGDVQVLGHAASGDTVVVAYGSPATFGDVAVLRDGELAPLTDFSAPLRDRGIVVPAEHVFLGRDGYEIHGWVATPAATGPHPTLLLIHGGPFADYTVRLFDEVQVYVAAGYAVVYCNPQGSAGYGRAHGLAIKEAMGTVDLHDVLDFLDAALDADPALDRERLGILGGSYGGYLTAWTIAHDHRFRAAVAERGYFDPEAFVGSSDIGWFFPQQYNGVDLEGIRSQSPQALAHRVRTPTLVIHSQNDLRCPIGQAETYYTTLALAGVPAEMLIFPGEDHELSRSGRPRHRVQRFEAILDWFARHV